MGYEPGNKSFQNGVNPRSFASNLSRTATSAAELMTLPPYSRIKSIMIAGTVASDAGTSGRISLSSNGGSTGGLLAQFNVKTNGASVSYPSSFSMEWGANDPNPIVVTGLYAEDGQASTTGGPWTVVIDLL